MSKNKHNDQGPAATCQSVSQSKPVGSLIKSGGGVQSRLMALAGVNHRNGDISDTLTIAERAYLSGNRKQAEAGFVEILKKEPQNARALTMYAILLNDKNRHEKSLPLLKKSLKINPNQPAALNALGTVYRVLGKIDESLSAFHQAHKMEPGSAEILNNMALAYREFGYFEEAGQYYELALSINPSLSEAWTGFSRSKRFDKAPDNLAMLRTLVDGGDMSKSSRRHAYYAMGKIYDDLEQFEMAFQCYANANNESTYVADADVDCATMAKVRDVFTAEKLGALNKVTPPFGPTRPVFILGMPRSGTTLIEQILSNHPTVFWGGELNYFTEKVINLRPKAITGVKAFPGSMLGITGRELMAIRKGFFKHLRDKRGRSYGKSRVVTDKTPFNFIYLGLIAAVFPDAIVIHCQRDFKDVGLSVFFTDFDKRLPFATSLLTIGKYIRCYHKIMNHWNEVMPLPILNVAYEDLVLSQEDQIRKIIKFCQLEWDDRCLVFHENKRHVGTPSDWQVRQPMYSSSIGRWKKYDDYLTPLRDGLGDLVG